MRRFLILILLVLPVFPLFAAEADFADAQLAAQEGRYRDVIFVLTQLIDGGELNEEQQVVAYANRGIAYSLLNAFAVAKVDLQQALAINPNHTLTLSQMGLLAEEVDEDYEQAVIFFEKAASQQYGVAQSHLAGLYRSGRGTARDFNAAFALYEAAVSHNNAMGLVPLGEMFLLGQGTVKDEKRAFELFKQAVDAGMVEGSFQLALAYDRGRGTGTNLKKAIEHYYFAAMQGHAEAQNVLGYMHRRGRGTKQSWSEAAHWYEMAADQENTDAMNRLAWLLAGCPTAALCDGKYAVELAVRAISIDPKSSYRDSLAAGHARSKEFDRAITVLQSLLADMNPSDGRAVSYQKRLAQYQQKRPMQLK